VLGCPQHRHVATYGTCDFREGQRPTTGSYPHAVGDRFVGSTIGPAHRWDYTLPSTRSQSNRVLLLHSNTRRTRQDASFPRNAAGHRQWHGGPDARSEPQRARVATAFKSRVEENAFSYEVGRPSDRSCGEIVITLVASAAGPADDRSCPESLYLIYAWPTFFVWKSYALTAK
jgi:hypothetical protein